MTTSNDQKKGGNDNNSSFWTWIVFFIFMSVLAGLVKGCTNAVLGKSFWDGFLEQSSTLIFIAVIFVIIIFLLIMGMIFGGRNGRLP